jgi:hypothetical protein
MFPLTEAAGTIPLGFISERLRLWLFVRWIAVMLPLPLLLLAVVDLAKWTAAGSMPTLRVSG